MSAVARRAAAVATTPHVAARSTGSVGRLSACGPPQETAARARPSSARVDPGNLITITPPPPHPPLPAPATSATLPAMRAATLITLALLAGGIPTARANACQYNLVQERFG